jgi:hypothetical protein
MLLKLKGGFFSQTALFLLMVFRFFGLALIALNCRIGGLDIRVFAFLVLHVTTAGLGFFSPQAHVGLTPARTTT